MDEEYRVKEPVLLRVNNLEVAFPSEQGPKSVVKGISFSLNHSEILGIVGESGSGKSITALTIMNLLSEDAIIMNGSIEYLGKDLFTMEKDERRALMGGQISMIFQEPMSSLNPLQKVGVQVAEMLSKHSDYQKNECMEKTKEIFLEVGLKDVHDIIDHYPHELSGGMCQRIMIAMAIICKPKLMIADEPTTALDVTVQAQILNLIKKINQKYNTSVIFISHDLGVIEHICSSTLVMNQGEIVESGSIKDILYHPQKEYTKNLIKAVPNCKTNWKEDLFVYNAESKDSVLTVEDLNVYYLVRGKRLFGGKEKKQILKQVSLYLQEGEILGIVGESGCGKSTLAKAIVGLIKEREGGIQAKGSSPQMVFQDPIGSINPAKTIGWVIEEPLRITGGFTKNEREKIVSDLVNQVGLQQEHLMRRVNDLSGGERQRVAIAIALVTNPKLIILDEPVSSLDVTIQAQILELLLQLREKYQLSYLFISHDLHVIHKMCDRICVMFKGEIVESALREDLFLKPQHPYTKLLLNSMIHPGISL